MSRTGVVVVGGGHYNTLWLVRSLGLAGYRPDVVVLQKEKRSFVCHSNYLQSFAVVQSEEDLIIELKKRKKVEKQVLLSSSDVVTRVLDMNYNVLCEYYVLPNCKNRAGEILFWMDKYNMLELAEKIGIKIPQTYSMHINNEGRDFLGNIIYPCLIKPRTSVLGHKEDFRICYDKSEVLRAFDTLKNSCEDVLIQQYLSRDYEFVVNGVRCGDVNIIPGVVRKVKVGKKLNNMGMTTIAYTDPEIDKYIDVSLIKTMMDQTAYNGIYSIEFIVSNGVPYLLEVNFRSDATVYISTRGGVNLPFLWYSLASNHVKRTCSYSEKVWGMAEVSYVKELPWKKPWQIVRDWWKTDCYSIFSWRDIKPFFYKFIYAI